MNARIGAVSSDDHRNRRVMSSSSGFLSSSVTTRGSRAMPQIGQEPGPSRTISGCIGQVHSVFVSGAAIDRLERHAALRDTRRAPSGGPPDPSGRCTRLPCRRCLPAAPNGHRSETLQATRGIGRGSSGGRSSTSAPVLELTGCVGRIDRHPADRIEDFAWGGRFGCCRHQRCAWPVRPRRPLPSAYRVSGRMLVSACPLQARARRMIE